MEQNHEAAEQAALIPIITDAIRNIDGYQMVRCSYFTIQSDDPLSHLSLSNSGFDSPAILLNLEAILIGAPNDQKRFNGIKDINALYEYVESNDNLYIDLNDIWVPIKMFGTEKITQGMLFRIPDYYFSLCWKLRNDRISSEELFGHIGKDYLDPATESPPHPLLKHSKKETNAFKRWTKRQIEESRKIYKANKSEALKKIEE